MLLSLRDSLAGSTGLDWNSNIAIEEWDGITISGTPPRVTELSLSQRGLRQDDCKVFFYPLMVSLSNHRWLVWASFDKLRMSRNR